MLVWASEFPLGGNAKPSDILSIAQGWVAGSPHASWNRGDFDGASQEALQKARNGDQSVEYALVEDADQSWSGLRWRFLDEVGRQWLTDVVASDAEGALRVGVRVDCFVTEAGSQIPRAKKPYIVRQLLERIGGGKDGPLRVGDEPHLLKEREIPLAANLVRGTAGNSLPVVYFSQPLGRDTPTPTEAARWFSGMGHVVVEPSRPFSFALARESDGRNVYGGAIGVLWPGGAGRTARFLPRDFTGAKDVGVAVGETLRQALTFLQPASHCTWPALVERVSHRAFEELKSAGSTRVDKYVAAFDGEIAAKDEQINNLRSELSRVRWEIQALEAQLDRQGGATLLQPGRDPALYPGETADILCDALSKALQFFDQDSRRRHVLDDLLAHNSPTGAAADLAGQLNAALSSLKKFGQSERRALEQLGFTVSEAGKHVKVVFRDDERYTFTLPKTPSDHRSGKNAAAKITRQLF